MRTILSKRSRSGRLWVGAALIAALAVGVVLGSSFAPRSAAAAQAALTFSGRSAIVYFAVNPAETASFERVMTAYGESLSGSDNGQLNQMAEGLKLYRLADAGPNNYVVYYLWIDPGVSGANYQYFQVLNDEYMGGAPGNGDEVRALFAAFSGAIEGGGQQTISLNLVRDF